MQKIKIFYIIIILLTKVNAYGQTGYYDYDTIQWSKIDTIDFSGANTMLVFYKDKSIRKIQTDYIGSTASGTSVYRLADNKLSSAVSVSISDVYKTRSETHYVFSNGKMTKYIDGAIQTTDDGTKAFQGTELYIQKGFKDALAKAKFNQIKEIDPIVDNIQFDGNLKEKHFDANTHTFINPDSANSIPTKIDGIGITCYYRNDSLVKLEHYSSFFNTRSYYFNEGKLIFVLESKEIHADSKCNGGTEYRKCYFSNNELIGYIKIKASKCYPNGNFENEEENKRIFLLNELAIDLKIVKQNSNK